MIVTNCNFKIFFFISQCIYHCHFANKMFYFQLLFDKEYIFKLNF